MSDEIERSMAPASWLHQMTEISNIPGHEAGVQVIDRPPGVSATPHFHPDGHEWVYVVSGSLAFHNGTQPEKLLRAGDVDYIAPNVVHHGRNPSDSEPVKLVLFRVKPVGQPVLIRA